MPKAVIIIDMSGEKFHANDPMDQLSDVLGRMAWDIEDNGFMSAPTDEEGNECGTATIETDEPNGGKLDLARSPLIVQSFEDSQEYSRNGRADLRGVEIYFGPDTVQFNGLTRKTGAVVANGGFVFSHPDFLKIIAAIDALGRS